MGRGKRRTSHGALARWLVVAALALAPLATAQSPGAPGVPPPPGDSGLDLTKIPDELLTPEGRRQKAQLLKGAQPGGTGALASPGGVPGGGGAPPGGEAGDKAATEQAKSLLDTVEPIIPRANADLEAVSSHARAILALANACIGAQCPVVKSCATAASLVQALVDAETYLDAMLGALNRAAADSAAAHSNVVAQTRITSVNLDRAIRVLAIQDFLNRFSSMMFNLASLADDINNMAKEGTLAPGDNLAAKVDGFYEGIKDLEAVMTDGMKAGAEWAGEDSDFVKSPVGDVTDKVFGTGGKTGLANDAKSSLSDAANAVDELRKKMKEAKDAGKSLNPKDVLGGLSKAAGKILYRDLKAYSDKLIAENRKYIDELLSNLSAEERILADLFLQRMRIGERRWVAEDALRAVREAKAALLACLARACGNPTLTRPVLPDYYAPPAGMSASDLAKHFGWGTALRDLNPRIADAEIRLRERFEVQDSCPGGGGTGISLPPDGGVTGLPGVEPRIRELFRANCPECQPAADRLAAIVSQEAYAESEIARIEANLRQARTVLRKLDSTQRQLDALDARRRALRERIRRSFLKDAHAQQDLAVADGERIELLGELSYLRREIERLEAEKDRLPALRDRRTSLALQEGDARIALEACERERCQPVTVGTVVGLGGVNPFDPNNPIGSTGSGTPATPGSPGRLAFSSANYGGTEGGVILITVDRRGGTSGTVSVGYLTNGGSATEGADYKPEFGRLTLADGERSGILAVNLVDDTLVEGDETFTMTLLDPQGATLDEPHIATITIHDNDGAAPPPQPAGSIQLSSSTYSAAEGQGQVTITATRTGGSNGQVSVQFGTGPASATAGADYQPASGTLVWESGDAAPKTFTVGIVDDTLVEGPETFFVNLSSPTGGATLGSPATGTVTISDNDVATGPCGAQGSAWAPNAGAPYFCSGTCNPCPSPQTVTVAGDRVTISPFHAGGAATFTGCSVSLNSDSNTLTYFSQSNHRATITRTSDNAFTSNIVSSGGGTCSMTCTRAGP